MVSSRQLVAGEPTALGVAGSPTLDLTVSGTGTAADPYEITGAVLLDQVNVVSARRSGAGQLLTDAGCCPGGSGQPFVAEVGHDVRWQRRW